jgi:toxin HigB-1
MEEWVMIKTFRHKGLQLLFNKNNESRIRPDLVKRVRRRLDILDQASTLEELNILGFNFHTLKGHKPKRYTIHVNGPYCITFEWQDGHVYAVDFENYH